ncbi:hypothetical protein ANRL4_03544 [Anaerolineae bacterium]|nr:hypothetical protein ANRL4_03544 [Anaerolineae bacterium]
MIALRVFLALTAIGMIVWLWVDSSRAWHWPFWAVVFLATLLSGVVSARRDEGGVDNLPRRFVPSAWFVVLAFVWLLVRSSSK